uniref:hypothetical protein n=1 Tax=Aeromonas sp. QDB25 TaxID=2989832 RepID=UPI003FA48642
KQPCAHLNNEPFDTLYPPPVFTFRLFRLGDNYSDTGGPVAADDYAHWAPAEGEPGTTELMAWYAQAQVGDSTFAV